MRWEESRGKMGGGGGRGNERDLDRSMGGRWRKGARGNTGVRGNMVFGGRVEKINGGGRVKD